GTTRLYRILISESAYLIWLLRNERVINGKTLHPDEIRNRWKHRLDIRTFDCLMTNKAKYKSKAIKKSLVLATWTKIIQDEDRLPPDWTRETGVLVGIG
ncbi:hypothetical protein C8R46DRAFT_905409, partial [Mycena filopes]